MKIRSGDTVEVITGDDRGKQGRVLRSLPEKNRIIVEGVKVVYKHVRKSQKNPRGGRIQKEASIHVSNVKLVSRADSGKRAKKAAKKAAKKQEADKE